MGELVFKPVALGLRLCQVVAVKFDELLSIVSGEPVFSSSLLLAGESGSESVRCQLSRWVKTGKLIQLRRSVYMLAIPYRNKEPHPFLLANRMKAASYVSLQSALAYYGLIPEYVPVVTSVTTGRPEVVNLPVGTFSFKHVKKSFFSGYTRLSLTGGEFAFIAFPEKALLDLVHLTSGGDCLEYLSGLRLQNLDQLNLERLRNYAESMNSAKLCRAVKCIVDLLGKEEYIEL